MTCNLFIVWGDPTKPESAEIDEFSFYALEDAEKYVNQRRKQAGEKRRAVIMEAVESHDGQRWKKAVS